MRQSKCHPPCEERGLPLQDEAYPAEVSLDPGASRRARADEDPHDREWVRHADQGADSRQAASMPKADWIRKTFHAGVKGEFLGNMSLRMEPNRTGCKMQRTSSSQNRPRSVPTDWEDRDVNMPKSHMGINMT